MLTRMEEVRAQVAERDELIEIIAIALLTRKNVFILGDTGQAKSAVINLFRASITGTNQFERLMSKQTDEEALFGRLDLSSLIPGGVPEEVLEKDQHYQELRRKLETELQTGGPNSASQLADLTAEMEQYRKALAELHSGEPRIITKGKLPDSHIVFLDEIFKASDGMRVGQMEAFIVKGQYNCVSDTRSYKKPFIPVVTEYLLLFHKQDALFFPFAVRRETTVDLRKEDIPGLTWHHLIRLTMEELSGRAKLSDLGDRLAAHPKAKKNPHFRDRIRATAYEHPGQYISCGNGFYALNYAVA